MKIHRVVQMLGATTSTGKLADDMYDLNYKTYYSEAEGRDIPISHMDFQHMVRAFVKMCDSDTEKVFGSPATILDALSKKDDLLHKQEDKILALSSKICNLLSTIEEKEESAEYWKNTYYNSQPKGCGYVFSEIPNDTDGQEFVDKMKKYFNKKTYKMRVRGQHIKPELKGTGATYWGQNLDESTHIRIYIEPKKGD